MPDQGATIKGRNPQHDMDHQDITVTDEMQAEPLLRALEAGWTTPEDRVFAVPILQWVHSVLVAESAGKALHADRKNCCSYDTTLQGQDQKNSLRAVMTALGVMELSGPSVPSFARHFVNAVWSLHLRDSFTTTTVLIRLNVHILAQVISAIQTSMEKAAPDSEHISGSTRRELPTFDSEAVKVLWGKLLPLYVRFFKDLYIRMRFHRLDGVVDRIQSRRSLETSA